MTIDLALVLNQHNFMRFGYFEPLKQSEIDMVRLDLVAFCMLLFFLHMDSFDFGSDFLVLLTGHLLLLIEQMLLILFSRCHLSFSLPLLPSKFSHNA